MEFLKPRSRKEKMSKSGVPVPVQFLILLIFGQFGAFSCDTCVTWICSVSSKKHMLENVQLRTELSTSWFQDRPLSMIIEIVITETFSNSPYLSMTHKLATALSNLPRLLNDSTAPAGGLLKLPKLNTSFPSCVWIFRLRHLDERCYNKNSTLKFRI